MIDSILIAGYRCVWFWVESIYTICTAISMNFNIFFFYRPRDWFNDAIYILAQSSYANWFFYTGCAIEMNALFFNHFKNKPIFPCAWLQATFSVEISTRDIDFVWLRIFIEVSLVPLQTCWQPRHFRNYHSSFSEASKQKCFHTEQSSFSSWQGPLCVFVFFPQLLSVRAFCTQSYRNIILFLDINAALTPSWPKNLLFFSFCNGWKNPLKRTNLRGTEYCVVCFLVG